MLALRVGRGSGLPRVVLRRSRWNRRFARGILPLVFLLASVLPVPSSSSVPDGCRNCRRSRRNTLWMHAFASPCADLPSRHSSHVAARSPLLATEHLPSFRAARGGGRPSRHSRPAPGGRDERLDEPPDLPSLLLNRRIVYVGLPLVIPVANLIVSQLLHLAAASASDPIHMYVKSSGSEDAMGRPVAPIPSALSILDVIEYSPTPVYTYAIGEVRGTAAALVAAGEQGRRYAMPHASLLLRLQGAAVEVSPADDVAVRAREMLRCRDEIVAALSKSTGTSRPRIANDFGRNTYLTPSEAQAYGIVDVVLHPSDGNGDLGTSHAASTA
eukprot:GHVU01173847.1.p1 GENE.GHVU01173847.1~~GHVU01173847.1.p1  ORF type:complete len:328 (-),score=39.31 GHVU01173847.1:1788-2771(-)